MTDTAKGMPLSKLAMNPPVTFEICIKTMTDTTKPTSDKGCTVKLWDRANFRYFVSDEAVDVYHETNLTPRQLLERVRELEAEQAELVQFFTELANDSVVFGLDTEFGDGFSVGVKTVCDAIKAALAKHGEGV